MARMEGRNTVKLSLLSQIRLFFIRMQIKLFGDSPDDIIWSMTPTDRRNERMKRRYGFTHLDYRPTIKVPPPDQCFTMPIDDIEIISEEQYQRLKAIEAHLGFPKT
jgi:hypothetical protein